MNHTVETFAKRFKHSGKVAATLNKVLVKMRSHEKMLIPTSCMTNYEGMCPSKNYRPMGRSTSTLPRNPCSRALSKSLLRDFSIDKCGLEDDSVQLVKDYYVPDGLPEGITDLFYNDSG